MSTMKNEQDYIRAGVKIADGWKIDPNGVWPPFPFPAKSDIDAVEPIMLDALAAQLVRQVDAINPGHSFSSFDDEAGFFEPDWDGWHIHYRVQGPDRTMNTIKAIVDSGVLA